MSATGFDLWPVIDLFWLCHVRMPAVEGYAVVRQQLPHEGTPMEQDSWIMWAFEVIYSEVMRAQADDKAEDKIAQQHRTSHERILKGGR